MLGIKDKNNLIFILMTASTITGIVLAQIGAFYIWFQGVCYVGAYYYGETPHNLIEGVKVKITDFWGRSQEVITSNSRVNLTLYFHGWYRVEAAYKGSTNTIIITTTTFDSGSVGSIYVILEEDGAIKYIMYMYTYKY